MAILSLIIVYILMGITTRYNRSKAYNSIVRNTEVFHNFNEKQNTSEAAEIKNMILIAASDNVTFNSPKCRILASLLNTLKAYEDPDEFLDQNPHILDTIFTGG